MIASLLNQNYDSMCAEIYRINKQLKLNLLSYLIILLILTLHEMVALIYIYCFINVWIYEFQNFDFTLYKSQSVCFLCLFFNPCENHICVIVVVLAGGLSMGKSENKATSNLQGMSLQGTKSNQF